MNLQDALFLELECAHEVAACDDRSAQRLEIEDMFQDFALYLQGDCLEGSHDRGPRNERSEFLDSRVGKVLKLESGRMVSSRLRLRYSGCYLIIYLILRLRVLSVNSRSGSAT